MYTYIVYLLQLNELSSASQSFSLLNCKLRSAKSYFTYHSITILNIN